MRETKLCLAFQFTCEDCGRDTFVKPEIVSPDAIDPEDLDRSEDVSDYEHLEAVAEAAECLAEMKEHGLNLCGVPERVKCDHCGAEFRTEES